MKLLSKTDDASKVLEDYKRAYCRAGIWSEYPLSAIWKHQQEETYKELLAAKPLTNEVANRIIGNASWSGYECNQCRESDFDHLLEIDEAGDETCAFVLCQECAEQYCQEIKAAFKVTG
jgi:hypothetical protein